LYLPLFVTKYLQTYRQLRRELDRAQCLQLNHSLNLELYVPLCAALDDETLAALYLKIDPSFFASLYCAFYRQKYR